MPYQHQMFVSAAINQQKDFDMCCCRVEEIWSEFLYMEEKLFLYRVSLRQIKDYTFFFFYGCTLQPVYENRLLMLLVK